MELADWSGLDRAIEVLRDLQFQLEAVLATPHPSELAPGYIAKVEMIEDHMRTMWSDESWLGELLTPRYWQIRELRSSSIRPHPLVAAEVRYQVARLSRMQTALEAVASEDRKADLTAVRVVPDTNIHLHFKPFTDIDWRKEVQAKSVRLVIPVVTVRELDNHKNLGRHPIGHRASSRLRAMHQLLEGLGRGPARVRDGVTIEVLIDPPGHERQESGDQEFLARAESFRTRAGGPMLLTTGDLAMRLQAEALGLKVMVLPEELRLPIENPE